MRVQKTYITQYRLFSHLPLVQVSSLRVTSLALRTTDSGHF